MNIQIIYNEDTVTILLDGKVETTIYIDEWRLKILIEDNSACPLWAHVLKLISEKLE